MGKTSIIAALVFASLTRTASAQEAAGANWANPADAQAVGAGIAAVKADAEEPQTLPPAVEAELDADERAQAEEPAPATQPAPAASPAAASARELMRHHRPALKALYESSGPGSVPDGAARGYASVLPGTVVGAVSEFVFGLWRGKVFERTGDTTANLINRTVFGKAFKAKVYIGQSLLDGKDSIIIDYRKTGFLPFRAIRDEIRQVGPGVYLGYAYLRGIDKAPVLFALDFNQK